MESNEVTEPEVTNGQPGNGAGDHEEFDLQTLRNILEGLLLAAARPLSLDQLQNLLGGETAPDKGTIRRALKALEEDCADRGIELVEVASGFRLQVRQELQPWVSRLWEERPPRYSRALLETLALIAYRQPITRGEIEDVRGVSVSTNIIRQLEEREWIRVVGHRDVPGKPALFGTTKAFLDYFGLKSLDDLPSLAEIRDIDNLEPEFDFSGESEAAGTGEHPEGPVAVTDNPEERDGEVTADDAIAGRASDPESSKEPAGASDAPSPDGAEEAGESEQDEPASGASGEAPDEETGGERSGEDSMRGNEAASGGRH